jgi:hypothetical protein
MAHGLHEFHRFEVILSDPCNPFDPWAIVSNGCVPDETGAKKFDFSEKSNFWAGQG